MNGKAKTLTACIAVVAAINAHGQTSQNPVLREMALVHPLADANAQHTGDLTGNAALETVRRGASRNELRVVDDRGRQVGLIKAEQGIEGFTIDDVDRDGQAEVIVVSHQLHTLSAYDARGNRQQSLDDALLRMARSYYETTIEEALDSLALKAANGPQTGGIPIPVPEGPDVISCLNWLEDEEDVLVWNEVDFDGLTGLPLIQGTQGNDVIIGTNFSDVIVGGSGFDVICAAGGDDWVYPEHREFEGDPTPPFNDTGPDFVFGGNGDDIIVAGFRNDVLLGGNGNDSLFGGHGNDSLEGDAVYITFSGELPSVYGIGDDFLVGMWGSDTVEGNAGSDVVNATAFDDVQEETQFFMNTHPVDSDYCYVHAVPESFWASAGGCENVIISDW